ncbi:MAG TPA: hypothetical protein VEC17_01050, partial [Candidatus Binatia bacterium]|nr:hypothetical protein [Candidatus Binatia bacterium]
AARKAGDEALIRVIRKAMHALPNGLTQFLNAWQPSKSKEAISTMCDVIADKFSQAEREAGDIDRGRKALYRRY